MRGWHREQLETLALPINLNGDDNSVSKLVCQLFVIYSIARVWTIDTFCPHDDSLKQSFYPLALSSGDLEMMILNMVARHRSTVLHGEHTTYSASKLYNRNIFEVEFIEQLFFFFLWVIFCNLIVIWYVSSFRGLLMIYMAKDKLL